MSYSSQNLQISYTSTFALEVENYLQQLEASETQHTKDDKRKEKDDDFQVEHEENDMIQVEGEGRREHVRHSNRKQK